MFSIHCMVRLNWTRFYISLLHSPLHLVPPTWVGSDLSYPSMVSDCNVMKTKPPSVCMYTCFFFVFFPSSSLGPKFDVILTEISSLSTDALQTPMQAAAWHQKHLATSTHWVQYKDTLKILSSFGLLSVILVILQRCNFPSPVLAFTKHYGVLQSEDWPSTLPSKLERSP